MKTVKLSKVFTKKYSMYLAMMMFVLIFWFMFFAHVITAVGENYVGNEKDGKEAIEYHGRYLVLEFENADRAIKTLVLFSAFFLILIVICCVCTFLYSKSTARTMNTSLSYLKMMTEKIRNEEYGFLEYQEKISEFAEVEEAFCIMAEKINKEIEHTRRSEEARKKLMLDISHDLKNPLMSIDGYVELILENTKEDNQGKYLKIISENSKRANQLVMDLFEFAKMESAEYVMELKRVDLAEMVKTVMIERLDELKCNGIETDFFIHDEEILIMGNETELRRALSNILNNVMKYHKEKSVFKVVCEQYKNRAYLMFSNASALKLEETEKLMDPFVRLDGSGELNAQGVGLGLSIVRKIIEAHKGTVNCCSDQDGDFKISIELPYRSGT